MTSYIHESKYTTLSILIIQKEYWWFAVLFLNNKETKYTKVKSKRKTKPDETKILEY